MSRKLTLPEARSYRSIAYRNIYTIKESQNLFDDLCDHEKETEELASWAEKASGIDHARPQKERPFQYGSLETTLTAFFPEKWAEGRFGDGRTYGVWYGAKEIETSVKEAAYASYLFYRSDLKAHQNPIQSDRKLFKVSLQTKKCVSLLSFQKKYKQLVHPHDYSFCQSLGAMAVDQKIEMFRTPSVRHPKGTCFPVFSPSVIKKEQVLRYVHFIFYPNGSIQITHDEDEMIHFPKEWL